MTFEIQRLAWDFGIEHLGFLTLTFGDHVTRVSEAQRRFHSLATNVLRTRYKRAICVMERSKSRRIHFHLVVVLTPDIRTSCDFEAIARGDYRSANASLRSEWAFWRQTAGQYRFGRTELLPVKSCAEGIARYVGKYVAKHIESRDIEDKGARVVRYIGFGAGDRKGSAQFGWATDGGRQWRKNLAQFARSVGADTVEDLQRMFGKRWAYYFADTIMSIGHPQPARPLPVPPLSGG